MKFKLQQKEAGKALTVFNVLDDKGGTIGSVNVPNKEVPSFVQHWKGDVAATKKPDSRVVMTRALLEKRSTRSATEARKAVLRGG